MLLWHSLTYPYYLFSCSNNNTIRKLMQPPPIHNFNYLPAKDYSTTAKATSSQHLTLTSHLSEAGKTSVSLREFYPRFSIYYHLPINSTRGRKNLCISGEYSIHSTQIYLYPSLRLLILGRKNLCISD